jgi:hypothetical protein
MIRRVLAALTVLAAGLLASQAASAAPLFSDPFSGTALNAAAWCPDNNADFGCRSVQAARFSTAVSVPAQTKVGGGVASMTLIRKPYTLNGVTYPYRTGAFNGAGKQSYGPGHAFTARIWLPCTVGGRIENWPGFWFDARSGWPGTGEADLAEGLGGRVAWHYHFQLPDGTVGSIGAKVPGMCGWHVYSLYRGWSLLTFRYDGKVTGRVVNGDAALHGVKIATAPWFPRFENWACSQPWCGPTVPGATVRVDWFTAA